MSARAATAMLLLACACGRATTAEFNPCIASCVDGGVPGGMLMPVLCRSTCPAGFGCLSTDSGHVGGQCMILCRHDADCTNTYFHNRPPTCATKLDVSDVGPYGYCVDEPVVIQ